MNKNNPVTSTNDLFLNTVGWTTWSYCWNDMLSKLRIAETHCLWSKEGVNTADYSQNFKNKGVCQNLKWVKLLLSIAVCCSLDTFTLQTLSNYDTVLHLKYALS